MALVFPDSLQPSFTQGLDNDTDNLQKHHQRSAYLRATLDALSYFRQMERRVTHKGRKNVTRSILGCFWRISPLRACALLKYDVVTFRYICLRIVTQ
mgnify:CR=1 FL=1